MSEQIVEDGRASTAHPPAGMSPRELKLGEWIAIIERTPYVMGRVMGYGPDNRTLILQPWCETEALDFTFSGLVESLLKLVLAARNPKPEKRRYRGRKQAKVASEAELGIDEAPDGLIPEGIRWHFNETDCSVEFAEGSQTSIIRIANVLPLAIDTVV